LVGRELLQSDGKGQSTFYFLPGEHPIQASGASSVLGLEGASYEHLPANPEHLPANPEHLPANPEHLGTNSEHLDPHAPLYQISADDWAHLLADTAAIRETGKVNDRNQIHEAILAVTQGRFLTLVQISALLGRKKDSLRNHYINTMLDAGQLRPEFPGIKSHPKQRYTAASA
jgi:ATP-dependent DNA helicase RecG